MDVESYECPNVEGWWLRTSTKGYMIIAAKLDEEDRIVLANACDVKEKSVIEDGMLADDLPENDDVAWYWLGLSIYPMGTIDTISMKMKDESAIPEHCIGCEHRPENKTVDVREEISKIVSARKSVADNVADSIANQIASREEESDDSDERGW